MKRPTAVIDSLWLQQAHDAFRASVDGTPDATKTMAAWMQERGFWPSTMSIDSAVSKFRHCLNGTHGERFRTLELIALSVQFGGDDLLAFWAHSAGYRLVKVPDAEFDAELVAGFDARLSAIENGLAELNGVGKLMAIRNQYDERQAARASGSDVAKAMFAKALEGPL